MDYLCLRHLIRCCPRKGGGCLGWKLFPRVSFCCEVPACCHGCFCGHTLYYELLL
ncbi:hypothetical protein B0O99DRAFT_633557, partial [Bisporella sp. PMI_857]